MVCDVHRALYWIDIYHLHAERLLHIRTNAVYACAAIATGVRPARIFLYLYKPHAVFVDYDKIDRTAALHGGEDPVSEPQEMLRANQFANVTVDMSLVRQGSPAAWRAAQCVRSSAGIVGYPEAVLRPHASP